MQNKNNLKTLGQKIENIKQFLPEYVRKNIKSFSIILNSGIHVWNEEKAKENYETIIVFVRFCIDELEKQEKERKEKKIITKKINSLVNGRKKQ